MSSNASSLQFVLRSLRHRNYRLFFIGQSLSLIGTWMTQVATSWLIYRLTNSAWLLGLVGFSGQLPAFFLAPFAGVWVDRWDRHRTLKITQTLSMIESFALAAVVFTGHTHVWNIVALTAFQGVVNAVDMPARQAFLVEMVTDRADLANAIALNSSMVNGARLIGPSIAGVVIGIAGEAYCFLIDGFSYLAVIASLFFMATTPSARRVRANLWHELKEGLNYVRGFTPIRSILLLLMCVSLVGIPYSVLLPIFASDVLHGGPHTLGFLTGASGLGALISAITLAARKTIVGLGRVIAITACTFGIGLIGLGLSHWLWISLPLMLVTGFSMMQQMSSSNTIMQTIVEENKRGRVMSFYTMAFIGVAPFGSLMAGFAASRFGAPRTVMAGGVLCILAGMWFSRQLAEIRKV
ncbi:MAG TPA: MFS transporter, partial [Terriglobia bacterium]|nr:MFS transporter [Terriglobia bacterium]